MSEVLEKYKNLKFALLFGDFYPKNVVNPFCFFYLFHRSFFD